MLRLGEFKIGLCSSGDKATLNGIKSVIVRAKSTLTDLVAGIRGIFLILNKEL